MTIIFVDGGHLLLFLLLPFSWSCVIPNQDKESTHCIFNDNWALDFQRLLIIVCCACSYILTSLFYLISLWCRIAGSLDLLLPRGSVLVLYWKSMWIYLMKKCVPWSRLHVISQSYKSFNFLISLLEKCSKIEEFGGSCFRGRLMDAYRFLHKEKDMDCGFSWSGNPIGK